MPAQCKRRLSALLLGGLCLAFGGCSAPEEEKARHYPKRYAVQMHHRGLLALDSGRPKLALNYMETALEEDPAYYKAWLSKAYALVQLGRTDAAAEALEEAIAVRPEAPIAYMLRGLLEEQRAGPGAGKTYYGQAVERYGKDMNDPENVVHQAVALYLYRGPVPAIRVLNDLLERRPDTEAGKFVKELITKDQRAYFLAWAAPGQKSPYRIYAPEFDADAEDRTED